MVPIAISQLPYRNVPKEVSDCKITIARMGMPSKVDGLTRRGSTPRWTRCGSHAASIGSRCPAARRQCEHPDPHGPGQET